MAKPAAAIFQTPSLKWIVTSARSLDAIDALGIRNNTIAVFTSDNGPEASWPWQGSSGSWRGYYFTHMKGSLRVPFIIRWPGRTPASRVSNEIVHEVDTFTTFAKIEGGSSRKIDRSTEWIRPISCWANPRSLTVKVVFYDEERDWWTPPLKLGVPKAFDLIIDPKEEYPQQSCEIHGTQVRR